MSSDLIGSSKFLLSFLVLDRILSVSNIQHSCFCSFPIFRSGLDKVYLFTDFYYCLYCGCAADNRELQQSGRRRQMGTSKHCNRQGQQTTIFRKYLFGRRFEIYNFRNICCKISCLPVSPRIFEHLKNGIIAHF